MKCPTCGENTPDNWGALYRRSPGGGVTDALNGPKPHNREVRFAWMHCANGACGELVVRGMEGYGDGGDAIVTSQWLVRPRHRTRPVDALVPERFRDDFLEAAALLDISPRMSAVLSRSILADLLEEYAGLDEFSLAARIDDFIADSSHPYAVRENLHYLREIADLSAHTKKNDQGEVVAIDHDEAAWTLDVVESLFEHFIVAPEKSRKLRKGVDQKLEETNRKAIERLPDAPTDPALPSQE